MIALSNKTKFEERTLNKFLHMTWVFIDEGDSEHLIPILNTKISVLEKKISELQGSHQEVLKDKPPGENFKINFQNKLQINFQNTWMGPSIMGERTKEDADHCKL